MGCGQHARARDQPPALAGLINVLNPDRVLLGGLHRDLMAADPERLRAAVAKRSPWGRGSTVPLLPCALEQGGLIAAAELPWQPVLDAPSILRPSLNAQN